MTTHTPTPWIASGDRVKATTNKEDILYIGICPSRSTVNSMNECKKNASFIVRACNAHEELLSALKDCLSDMKWAEEKAGANFRSSILKAEYVIAKAEGK